MINSQMANPFAVGDLVHIPQGVVLYFIDDSRVSSVVSPKKVNGKSTVALVLNKKYGEYYNISIGNEEFLVKKEDMALVSRKAIR